MKESFSDLLLKLKLACENKDWTQLKALDQQIRKSLEYQVSKAESKEEKSELAMSLASINKIYQLVIDDSVRHQGEISSELQKLTRDKRAADSYLGVSRF